MARDPDVESLLQNGDMEQLATLVLNGEGRRLVGRQTGNPELQTFIDNVPAYMVCHCQCNNRTQEWNTQTYIYV